MPEEKKYDLKINKSDSFVIPSDLLFADYDGAGTEVDVHVLIRSGQYFATIATKLDKILKDIRETSVSAKTELQKLVEELLFLQEHYRITKKRP